MNIFGLSITRAVRPALQPASTWGGVGSGRGWWPLMVRDHYPGAWQANDEIRVGDVLSYWAVFSCVTLIASDIGKLRVKLVSQDGNGIWSETESPAFSPVLRKPNHYQTRIKFFEQWVTSKLVWGNAYVLKERDQRGVVVALYVLDPCKVTPLIAPNGDVYYDLRRHDLAGLERDENITVPAREIIHDLMVPLYHPLVGVSPIYACGLAALQGLRIQDNSVNFFTNNSQPSGLLLAPGAISDGTADFVKNRWEENFSGANYGRVAVLADNLKYEPMTINAVDAQLTEQLKMTAETICATFHVPSYMIGAAAAPSYNNIEALSQQYYSQCLQSLIENLELCLDEGLALPVPYGTEFDLEGLLRMDTAAKVKAAADAIGAGFLAPNEARKSFDLTPVKGGQTPYLQQQNFSLAALDKRDRDDPFAKPEPAPAAPPTDEKTEPGPVPPPNKAMIIAEQMAALAEMKKGFANA
jgi:HK97 family phage portal protein